MTRDDEEQRDTIPPDGPDPVEVAFARFDAKLDIIIRDMRAFFDELNEQRRAREALAEEVARLVARDRRRANGNGAHHDDG